ncbi:hypothetical protein [Streptomyces cavernicola]|uniref:WXG100 family type VII secretion target n=1 Tax=Streptomyces cavernicola TaxID=3043613 RepID=A0ABT6SC28_9ACTN|nr:hypothetical protein [Streptomyces sp. B-S-A6]MDI3405753.1 hypothetical protein [Streptomyces sp. B-S-A6]
MSRIHIPVGELTDTMDALKDIRERIDRTAKLGNVGSEDDVGDSGLASAVNGFDSAWSAGHERVQENVDTFKEAAQGIVDNFTGTDEEAGKALDESK